MPALGRECRNNLAEEKYLGVLTWVCWFAMLISGIIWLFAAVALMTGSGVGVGAVEEVVRDTQFGHIWLFRLLLGFAIAGGLLHSKLRKMLHIQSDLLWISLAVVNLVSLAWAGHAGAAVGSF